MSERDQQPRHQAEDRQLRWRKKPVVIEAFRLGIDPMPDWFCEARTRNDIITRGQGDNWRSLSLAEIRTREGIMRANIGDWIIRGIQGEIYPCKPNIFEATYEPA